MENEIFSTLVNNFLNNSRTMIDERFGLVNWKSTEKYNVISMKDFEKSDDYNLDEEYRVKWNGQRYAAVLKFIGTSLIKISSLILYNFANFLTKIF